MKRSSYLKYTNLASASLASVLSALLLAACGGGGSGDATPATSSDPSAVSTQPASTSTPSGTSTPSASSASAAGAANGCSIANFQAEMLSAINAARASARSCGGTAKPAVAAVAWNNLLFNAAAGHSKDMVDRKYFDHNTPEGVDPFKRMQNAGYKFSYAGENIAYGQNGIASVMDAWLKSPDHCSIIMGANLKDVGTSCVKNASGTPYWTMDIAAPQ